MSGQRRLDSDELGSARQDELDAAMVAGRWLDDAVDRMTVTPGSAFADRVMGAIAGEPAPAPAGFLAPLRRRGVVFGFAASVRQAWASMGGAGRPLLVRAPALAYVLAVAIAGTSLAGVATLGVAGALGIFDARPSQTAPPQTPGPTPAPARTSQPTESPVPSGESAPPESGPPSASPEESDDHEGSSGPDESDDHGDNSGPGSSDSGSDDGSGSDDAEPSDTPRPTGTPRPTESPD